MERFIAFLLLSLALTAAGCRSPEPDLYRVIDHVKAGNVVNSPLKSADPKSAGPSSAAEGEILEDRDIGDNPFQIKRKIHVDSSDVNALAAPPPTEIEFRLKVPPRAVLEFEPAVRPDPGADPAASGDGAVTFRVVAVESGRETSLYRKSLGPQSGKPDAGESESIDLAAFAGREVAFRLITEGDKPSKAFWINPVLWRARDDARYVLLISLDTLRADHLGCYGYGRDTSPNIDALAGDGVRFNRVMASSSWTLPSHMSLMTGLTTVNHGVVAPDLRLDPGIPTLAEFLKARGFFNAAFTGGSYVRGSYGFSKGFDSYAAQPRKRDEALMLGNSARDFLKTRGDGDLFVFLHTYQIHAPFGPEEPFNRYFLEKGAAFDTIDVKALKLTHEKRYAPVSEDLRRNIIDLYDAEIRYTDASLVGPLVAWLKSRGLYDRTMIILTSDHGEEFYDHRGWLHAHSLYEEVLRVPLIIKFFGSRDAGKTVDAFVRGVDIMPTICQELGARLRPGAVDGKSLLGLIGGSGRAQERAGVGALAARGFDERFPAKLAVVSFPFKLIWNAPHSAEDLAYYGAYPPPQREIEIYDIAADPREAADLAASRPDLVKKLRGLMESLRVPRKKTAARKSVVGKDLQEELKALGYL